MVYKVRYFKFISGAINLVLGILLATLSGYIPMIFTNVA